MALDFPASPTQGQTFQDPATGIVWVFDTGKWRSGAGGGAYLPLSGGTLTGLVSGVDPPAGDSSGKFATTAWINNNRPQNRNRIINGDFLIDQWNSYATIAPANFQFACDRWVCWPSQLGMFVSSVSPMIGGPAQNMLKLTSSSSYAMTASDYFAVGQFLEYNSMGDFRWGTVQAQPVTLSFWALATVAGNYSGSLRNDSQTRSYPFSFTLPAAVWTYVTITATGDTTGNWAPVGGTARGLILTFDLGAAAQYRGPANVWSSASYGGVSGAASLVSTNGATLQFANVQLELGPQATPFDWRPYGEELALCQRYYQVFEQAWAAGYGVATGAIYGHFNLFPSMRTTPTVTLGTAIYSNAQTYQANATGATFVRVAANVIAAGLGWAVAAITLSAEL